MNIELMKNLTIENAEKAASELLKVLKSKTDVTVDLSSVERLDLSGIQLLISAQNTGEKQKHSFNYAGPMRKTIFDKLSNNGFSLVPIEEDSDLFKIRRSSGEF